MPRTTQAIATTRRGPKQAAAPGRAAPTAGEGGDAEADNGDDPFGLHLDAATDDDADAIHAAAEVGLEAPVGELPHRAALETSFGRDLSHVRAHQGPAADAANAAMGADAYATGADVVLPANASIGLVAHEVTHVFQQADGVQLSGGVGAEGDPYEREADAVGEAVSRGESVAARFAGAGAAAPRGGGVQRDKAKRPVAPAPPPGAKGTGAKPGDPAKPELSAEDQQRRQVMLANLPNVTARWKVIGFALFKADEMAPSPSLASAFQAGAYTLLFDDDTDLAAVERVVEGPGRDKYREALDHARNALARDRPRFEKIDAAIKDLQRAGDLQFNATILTANQALLSATGKRLLASRGAIATDALSAYLSGECAEHGVVARQADLEAKGIPEMYATPMAAVGRIERTNAVIKLLGTLRSGPPTVVGPNAPVDPEAVIAEATALKTTIGKQLGTVKPGGPPPLMIIGELSVAIQKAMPRAKELVWADAPTMSLIARVLDPAQAKLLIGKLDTVEALYQDVRPVVSDDLMIEKYTKGLPGAVLPKKHTLGAGNAAYPKIKSWLAERPGETNAALRGRVLAHTKLKDDVIDRLPADQGRIVYRLVVRGTAEATAEDSIHEAAEAGNGVAVVAALQAMAGSDPARLAELERDPLFRKSIERMTKPVNCNGVTMVPYHLALTMWGRSPSSAIDPLLAAVTETVVLKPGESDAPITAEERLRLTRELFAPALADVGAHVKGTNLEVRGEMMMNMTHLSRAQSVLDRLRVFERRAADEPYLTWLRRERLVAGAEFDRRFTEIHGIALRTWVYENGGPNIRSGTARILGTEQGAAIGEFNGKPVEMGQAEPGHMSMQQALRETKTNPLQRFGMGEEWTVSEFASIQSREVARGINDSDEERVLTNWHILKQVVAATHAKLQELTGISVRAIDLLRNAHMEHSGHLEARIDEKFEADARTRIRADLGLGAADASTLSPAEQAKARYDSLATALWKVTSALNAGSDVSTYGALYGLRATSMVVPRLDGTPGQLTDGDHEERPAKSFGGYYRLTYGISPRRHVIAVVRAMPDDDRAVPRHLAAGFLGLTLEEVNSHPTAGSEALVIDEHNQHLVHGSFTVETARGNAKQIWDILHGNGRLELVNGRLYGGCNDEEQRLIRIAFRKISGGIDLTFYIRQALASQQATADSTSYKLSQWSPLAGAAANLNQNQVSAVGGESTSLNPFDSGAVNVHGTQTELEAALAVASTGELDILTRLRTAAKNDNSDQVFRILEESTAAQRKAVLRDGALVNQLQRLGQWQWERCFKVLSGQSDLADRMYSRSHGDGTWTESSIFGGGTHEEGMKEDIRDYVKKLRKKCDAEVRAELTAKGLTGIPADIIDKEIARRVYEGCGHLMAHKDVQAIMKSELNNDEYGEIRALLAAGGSATEREWAVATGGGKAAVMTEIRGMSAERRQVRLKDPEYLRLLAERLTDEKDYRDAMNALSAPADADVSHDGGALARLDAASRTSDVVEGASRDGRKTLRALSELTPSELRKLQSDPQLQVQLLEGLDEEARGIARRLLEAPPDATAGADGAIDPKVAASSKADLLVRQAIGRLEVAFRGSWRDVLVQACAVYKLNLLSGFTRANEGGGNGESTLDDKSPLTAVDLLAKRQAILAGIAVPLTAFTTHHRDHPRDKTHSVITPERMDQVVRTAVLASADPSSALVDENILTVDEKFGGNEALKKLSQFQFGADATVDEDGLKDTLRAASDEHVIAHWTNVVQPGAEGGRTMQAAYLDFAAADERAVKIGDERKARMTAPPPPPAIAAPTTLAGGAGPVDPKVAVRSAVPQGPAATQGYATDTKQDDAAIRDARTKQRQFLEFAIKVSAELERMLLPFMGDDRAASQEINGEKIAGRSNKRYNALSEIILERVPSLPSASLGKAIGVKEQHGWLLASGMRKAAAEMYLRDEQYLRYRGDQTNNNGVAQTEKEAYDQEYTLLRRTNAMATTDGQITAGEGEDLQQRYDATDRASEEYQTAKATAAGWAALIVGVLVTLVVTVLTGGLATGAVAMFAISAATAALSATAKALVMKEYLGDEYDSKDMSEAIAKEVITGIVAAGTTFYAQKLLSAVGNATSLAKQAGAMRAVLRTPPKLWQEIGHEVLEEVVSEGMSTVVDAGLAATDPTYWMHGYEEGSREAKAAAMAQLAQADKRMMHAAVSSILISGGGRVFKGKQKPSSQDHALAGRLKVPANQKKRAVDLAANARQVFGDPGDKVLEALVQWGLEQADSDGPINWSAAPADILKGVIEEFGEEGTSMATATAHKGNRKRRMDEDLKRADKTLPAHTAKAFRDMHAEAHDTEAYVSLDQFVRARQEIASRGLEATLAKTKATLTDAQKAAFLAWVNTADSAEQLAQYAHTDPQSLPEVMAAGTATAKPDRTHHAGAFPAVTDAPPAPPPAPPAPPKPHERATVTMPAARPTEQMPAADPATAEGASDRTATPTPTPTPASTRPTVVIDTPTVAHDDGPTAASERATQQITAVDPAAAAPAAAHRDLRTELPDLAHVASLSHDVIGTHQQGAIESALQQLSAQDYQTFRTLHASEPSAVGKGFLYKALAAGNDVASVGWLAGQIRGKDAGWMLDNLTLGDPRGVGVGLAQQWSMSCNAATTLVVRGNYDPVFALGLRQANPNISNFDQMNPHAYNADLAAREKAMLESAYQGNLAGAQGSSGIAVPRAYGESRGRWADDLLNQQAGATGVGYTSHRQIDGPSALRIIAPALRNGMQVPVVVGHRHDQHAHYVLATGIRDGAGGPEYRFFNVASGISKWVTQEQILSGTMPLDGGVMITAVEEPTAIGRSGAAAPAAGGSASGGAHTLTVADAPQLTHVAMAAVTQKMPAAVATQVLAVQLADEGATSGPQAAAPQATSPQATSPQASGPQASVPTAHAAAPTMRIELPAPVAQAVATLVHPAAQTAVQTLAAKPGAQPDAARAEFERLWKDGVVDVAAFKAKYDMEYEDAVEKINRSKRSPELAAVLQNVPEAELVAILLYTSTHYVEWNRTLRAADKSSLPDVGDGIALADRGLSKLPIHQGWVFRGAESLPAEVLARYVPGEIITEQAFTSTSNASGAQYKGNVQFKIKSRTGRDVNGLSRYDNEAEVLFRPGTKFLVTDKERDGDTTVITLEEVEAAPGHAPGGPGGPGGPGAVGPTREARTDTAVDTDTDVDSDATPADDRGGEVEVPATPTNAEIKAALKKLAKLEHARTPNPDKIAKQREAMLELIGRANIRDPQRQAELAAMLDARTRALLAREVARHEQAVTNQQSVEADRARRERERAALGVEGEAGRHGGVEVHSHFLGVVETEVFHDAYGSWFAMLDAIDRIQVKEDKLAKTKGEASRKLSHALGKGGSILQRGTAGDALRIAREALATIREREAALRLQYGMDPRLLEARLQQMREQVAEEACRKCLASSDETDFNSAYEIRDELLQESFAGIAEDGPDGETPDQQKAREDANKVRVEAAYYELAKETVRRLMDDGLLLSEQSNSIGKLQRRFKNGVLERAISEVITDIASSDPKRAAELKQNFSVKFLSMGLGVNYGRLERKVERIDTTEGRVAGDSAEHRARQDKAAKAKNQTDWLVELVNQFGYDLAHQTLVDELDHLQHDQHVQVHHGNAENARIRELKGYLDELATKADFFKKLQSTNVVMRPDVVGIDTAGQELYEFTAAGKERFKVMYLALVQAARAKNERLVFRPHVGEGAINPKRGEHWNAFRNRWEDAEERPIHYERAAENLTAMIEVLQEMQAQGLLDSTAVTIRFGHASHMTPAQAVALAKLKADTGVGVIAEVNLGSNSATNAVEQGQDGARKPEEDFSDHSLLTLIYNQVQTILSTDGHAVEKTTMGEEYGRAFDLIEKFLAGKVKLRVTPDQAHGRGVARADGAVDLTVGDLDATELALFQHAYAQLHQWAAQYRTTSQRGGAPLDPDGGSRAVAPTDKDLASTETPYASPQLEKARQARLERSKRDDRAELGGQQAADVSALGTSIDDGGDEARARRERIASEIERQNPDLRLQDEVAGGAKTVLTLNVAGGGRFGVKTMNDKLVGMDINTDIIAARNEMLRAVLAPEFTVVEQNYKATTFVSKLPDGPGLQALLQTKLAEIDRRMQEILAAGLERGAAHWQSKDTDRAKENAKAAAEVRGGPFQMNATIGASAVGGDGDALTAKMNASRAALMSRIEPNQADGRDARSGSYDEGRFVALLEGAVATANRLVGQTVTLDGVAVPAFIADGGAARPNLDVLRAFRKNKLDPDSHKPEGERGLLREFKKYVDTVNTFDYFKHTLGSEHEAGGAVDQRQAQARAMIAALRDGDAVDIAEVDRLLHTNAAGVQVAQADTASEAQWYNSVRHQSDRIVLNLDVIDLGLGVQAAQAETMNKIVQGGLRGEALQDAALRTDDGVINGKRKALEDIRREYRAVLEEAIAEANDPAIKAALAGERDAPLLMGGDEFTLSIHPALRKYVPRLAEVLRKVANARVAVTEAHSGNAKSGRANQKAHRDAMQSSEAGHDTLKKKVEAAYQSLALRVGQLPERKLEKGEQILAESGLTGFYADIAPVPEGVTEKVVLREQGTGEEVDAQALEARIRNAEDRLAQLIQEP